MTITMQPVGKRVGQQDLYESYLVVSDEDKTASIKGPLIANRDGRVSAVYAQLIVEAWVGYKPQIRCRLLGGLTPQQALFSPLKDAQDRFIETVIMSMPATAHSASVLTVAALDTQQYARCYFPPALCLGIDVTGTEVAWQGRVAVCVIRS